MAGETTFDVVNGLSKRVYDTAVQKALPKAALVQKRFPLSGSKRLGDTYQVSVELQPPNGITYEGSDGALVALTGVSNMVIKQASVAPFAMSVRDQITIPALSRLRSQGEGALESLVSAYMLGQKMSLSNRMEASFLRGQSASGYGVVDSVTGVNADYMDVVFTEESFAAGIFWAFASGSKWSTWQAGGTVRKNADNTITLQRVTASTRTVRFLITDTVANSAAATDVFFPYSARTAASTYKECIGLTSQAGNTASSMMGIDAGDYPTWAGNTADVGGNLTYGGLEAYLSELRDRGAEGNLIVIGSNRQFSAFAAELEAARMLDSSYSPAKGKTGFRGLGYVSKDVGEIELLSHPFMPLGETLILPEEAVERVGSGEISFGIPGGDESQIWQYVADYNAAELRCHADQAVILKKPSHSYLLTGISFA